MQFKNPLGVCNLFATPESYNDLESYCLQYTGQERIIALTIMGMTMNLCASRVDSAIIEQDPEAEALRVAEIMRLDMLRDGG
ncbi:MAG: hypothetical protein GY799_29460 [Desulfobulbaceae bacterium]|nr:hypothetical protein [Desulfobulbaceae bacterium]